MMTCSLTKELCEIRFCWNLTSAHFLTPICSSSLEVQGNSQLLCIHSLRKGYTHSPFRRDAAVQTDVVLFTREKREYEADISVLCRSIDVQLLGPASLQS